MLGFTSLLQIKSPLERGKSSVCWDLLLTGRMGLGLQPLPLGDSPVLRADTGDVQQHLGFSAGCCWTLRMPRYESPEARWSGPRVLRLLWLWGASVLRGCWSRKSLSALCRYSLEQRLRSADQDRGWVSSAEGPPFPGGKRAWQWGQRSSILVAASAWRRASLTQSCSYEELLDFLE